MKLVNKNDLSTKSKIIVVIIYFLLSFILFASLILPGRGMYAVKYRPQENDVVSKIDQEDIISSNNCTFDERGKVSLNGADANFVFEGLKKPIRAVVLNFGEPVNKNFYAELFYDSQSDFSEDKKTTAFVLKGDEKVCFALPENSNKFIRIDIDVDYVFSSVELHSNEPTSKKVPVVATGSQYIICVIASIVWCALLVLFDNFVYPFSKKILTHIKSNRKKYIYAVINIAVSAIVSVPVEYIISLFNGSTSSANLKFNVFRYFFIFCIVQTVILLLIEFKDGFSNTSRLFAKLLFITGIAMLVCTPFGHITWDYGSHTRFVLQRSYIGDALVTDADRLILFSEEFYFPRETYADNLNNIKLLNSAGKNIIGIGDFDTTIGHLPASIGVAVSRFFGLSYFLANKNGELMQLLCYTIICYFAMKKLSSGKAILATVAFFPTCIFLATNYSYDWWVISFTFLGTAYFIEEFKRPQEAVSLKNNIIMCGSLLLAMVPKEIYIPLLVLPFFLYKKWNNKGERRRYYSVCTLALVVSLAFLFYRTFGEISSGGDMRGGSEVNVSGQMAFILGDILGYAKILLSFLKNYLSIGEMRGYIVNFAYLGIGKLIYLYIALIMFVVLTDKDESDRFKGSGWLRIINIIMFFGTMCLVATSLYIAFTPVGSEGIAGCQPRYIIPMLFPLLLTIGNGGINLKIDKRIYNTVVLVVLTAAAYYNLAAQILPKLM